jgi:hypothetical protein
MVRATANTPIGTLTRKIARQFQSVVIRPPSTGPAATAMPVIAPQMPKAVPRSLPRKLWPSSASEVANTTAPPMPWPHRDRMSISGSWARPHSRDPSVKIVSPIANSRLRPYRSASTPEVSSSDARVRAYASRVHWTSLKDACSPDWIAGWATTTMVTSSSSMKVPRQTAIRAHHFLSITWIPPMSAHESSVADDIA